ncbi:MAG: glycosyltransferase family protein, partial [Candidatus Humimicrobiaceae bacterium]
MKKKDNEKTEKITQESKVDAVDFSNIKYKRTDFDKDCLKFLKPGFKTSVLKKKNDGIKTIFISSYVPRKCGIATYTKDLTYAINEVNPCTSAEIIALIKPEDKIIYPPEVKFKIDQDDLDSYIKAAGYINSSNADIVVLEHEFGLYGGQYGNNIIKLLELVKKPLVITTHTIPDNPDEGYGEALKGIVSFGEKIIAMMPESIVKLKNKYGVPKKKVELIAHGVPDIPFVPNEGHKKEKGLEGRIILGNINLLSESKGLEYIIEALKEIKSEYNNILYLIIGQTHPVVLREYGERYRNFLKGKIKE